MTNEKTIPLEYCTPARAARLLGCELEDIFHWYEIGAIKIYIKLDEDGEWPSGGRGFQCKHIYFDEVIPGTICYQDEFGTTDTEDADIETGSLYNYGTDVVFLLSDEVDKGERYGDAKDEYKQDDRHIIWIKLERFEIPEINSDDTLEKRISAYEEVKKCDFTTYRVWLSGLHEVYIPYRYLRDGFRLGFENIEKIESVDLNVNIGTKCVSVISADIEHASSLFRVRYDDLSKLKDVIASGDSLKKQPRKLLNHTKMTNQNIDTSPRVTANQSKAIVDLLRSLGYTSDDLQGSTEALQKKIARNGHSIQLSSVTPKTLRAWIDRADAW